EKGERRFLLRESIQSDWQRRNRPEETRCKGSDEPHHSAAQEIKDCRGGGTEQHVGHTKPALGLRRRPVMPGGDPAPAFAHCQARPSKHFWQHRMLAIDPGKVSRSMIL